MIGYFDRYSKLLPKSGRDRQIIGSSVTFLWVAGLFLFLFMPTLRVALDANTKIENAEQTRNQVTANLASITRAERLLGEQIDNAELVSSALPLSPKSVTFANEVNLAAAANNLIVEKLDFGLSAGIPVDSTGTTSIDNLVPFSVQALGSYTELKSFMSHLETTSRIVSIGRFSIEALSTKELEGIASPEDNEDNNDENTEEETNEGAPLRLILIGATYFQPND